MKRLPLFILLGVAGLACGVTVAHLNTAFVPDCGEDCAAERLGSGMLWGLALLLVYPALGRGAFKKKGAGLRQAIGIATLLSLATIVPATALYGYQLHQRYWTSAPRYDIPNVDFSLMAIATRPVVASASATTSKAQVQAWERCAFGYTACDRPIRTVEAICLGSGQTVLISEADWPAFRRIKDEDLPGVHGLPGDMNLCPAR